MMTLSISRAGDGDGDGVEVGVAGRKGRHKAVIGTGERLKAPLRATRSRNVEVCATEYFNNILRTMRHSYLQSGNETAFIECNKRITAPSSRTQFRIQK